jgi:hypothetical protein
MRMRPGQADGRDGEECAFKCVTDAVSRHEQTGTPRPAGSREISVDFGVGRSLGWQVAIRAGLPGINQWQWSADSLRTIAGAATVLLCSLLGPSGFTLAGTDGRCIMPAFIDHQTASCMQFSRDARGEPQGGNGACRPG